MATPDIFTSKVVPVMNKVRDELCNKRADEMREHSFSLSSLGSMASDPFGVDNSVDSLMTTGKWNSKTVEDYIAMVKKELGRQHVTVTADLEKKMIDKMVKDSIPKSSIDYIIRKASTHSIFYLPTEVRKSPLQSEINEKAEQAYRPNYVEKASAWALGTAADIAASGGFTGGWRPALGLASIDAAADMATEYVFPKVFPETNQSSSEEKGKKKQEKPAGEVKKEKKLAAKSDDKDNVNERKQEEQKENDKDTPSKDSQQTDNGEQLKQQLGNGWDTLVSTLGLNGITDIGSNLGYVLAMLPDMIVGLFTGKTNSVSLKKDIVPLASVVAGMFVGNPLLKTMLMGFGGANLLNKVGHEALDRAEQRDAELQRGYAKGEDGNNYKVYADEELNHRASRPMITGDRLICDIDGVPCNIQLNSTIIQAYNAGCLPLNTLVNAILARNDNVHKVATTQYEDSQSQTVVRSRGV